MLIGSGLLARAFAPIASQKEQICIYAAGVSNSSCKSEHEFVRERVRLTDALQQNADADVFVYFGTCSVADPASRNTPYVHHKLAMEDLVRSHSRHLILRLPQVAGNTPNPHTLLNYLYARISRSESFTIWSKAKRNIIDIDDIVFVAQQLINEESTRNVILNIANPVSYAVLDIVRAMSAVVCKAAIFDILEKTSEYNIDVSRVRNLLDETPISAEGYLNNVLLKYYSTPKLNTNYI